MPGVDCRLNVISADTDMTSEVIILTLFTTILAIKHIKDKKNGPITFICSLPGLFQFVELDKAVSHTQPYSSRAPRVCSHSFLIIRQRSSVILLVEGYAGFTQ